MNRRPPVLTPLTRVSCICSGLLFLLGAACSKGSGFGGTSQQTKLVKTTPKKTPVPASNPNNESFDGKPKDGSADEEFPPVVKAEPSPVPPKSSFKIDSEFSTTLNKKEAWVVTDTTVTRFMLDESRGFPRTAWSMPSSPGNRTYVSEIGLLIGRTSNGTGHHGIWLANDSTPSQAVRIYQPTDMASGTRICVTTFRIGTQAFVGAAYGVDGGGGTFKKRFIRFPIDPTKPNKVDTSKVEGVTLSTVEGPHHPQIAAYGCFMDQARGILWAGAWHGLWGVNVKSFAEVAPSSMPNFGASNNAFSMSTTQSLNYALAGDLEGNVLSARGMYTFAHDPVNDVVFGSGAGNIYVTHGSCFRKPNMVCAGTPKHAQFPAAQVAGAIGPISTLGDGRVVGITRGNPGSIFLLTLKEPANFAAGIVAKKIGEVNGDPYMYNDFTGGTLYAATQEKTFEFSKIASFNKARPVEKLELQWSAESGTAESLRGLKFSLRCYKSTASRKPDYKDYTATLPKAGTPLVISAGDCSGDIDTLQIKVEPDNISSSFTRMKSVVIQGSQPG